MKLTLRLVTVICYFLPFSFFLTTCNNGLELRFSYNQAEADKNILLEKESSIVDTVEYDQQISTDTTKTNMITQNTLKDTVQMPSDALPKSPNYGDRILKKIVMPTDNSLSGIGSVFYFKNLTGQIVIVISLLISLILFIAFKFLKSQSTKLYLLLTGVLCLTIFMLDSYFSSVTLLWGSWTLLILLLLQSVLEFNDMRKAYRNQSV
jgi:membrane-bound ClpP family serine protease